MLIKIVGAMVVGFCVLFVLCAIMAYPIMLMVNFVFSPTALITMFGGPITFWKALVLNLLTAQLFKTSVSTKKE